MTNSSNNRYFDNIDKYSKEHMEVIDKFTYLLESMKDQRNNPEHKSHISDIHNSLKNFNNLIDKFSIKLTQSELDDIDKINSSDAKPVLKKRMLEDLFHRIKKNHKNSFEKEIPDEDAQKEIKLLKKHKMFFFDWLDLFLYSLNHDTITLFSHNYKDSSLSRIKNDLSSSLNQVIPYLKKILDNEYYIFSIIEYNSLVQILHLLKPLESINSISWEISYNASKIFNEMEQFCEVYLKILDASNIIDTVISKLGSKRKLPHGFYGHICSIIDTPIVNGKQVKYSKQDIIDKSFRGALLAYFTSKEKRIISSINQIKYILKLDTTINNAYKELTEDAIETEKQNRESESTNTDIDKKKYDHISSVFSIYIPYGKKIADNILKEESGYKSDSWIKNYETKPMFVPVKLIEALIKNYIERINTTNSIIFRYDSSEFPRYFENRREITSATKGLNSVDLGLTGGRLKELLEINSFQDDNQDFIQALARLETSAKSLKPDEAIAKDFIDTINSKVYNLAVNIHSTIDNYEERKEINFKLTEENYDFFINAELAAHKILKLNKIIGHQNITLEYFLKSLCSLCYYIADIFCSPAIKDLQMELLRIEKEYGFSNDNEDENEMEPEDVTSNQVTIKIEEPVIKNEEDHIDRITGLYKFSYFNNVLKKEQYTDLNRYKHKKRRLIFSIEIKNFHEINNKLGYDAGDRILLDTAKILIGESKQLNGITLFKYKNANIFGIYDSDNITELVKYIQRSAVKINKIRISKDGFEIKHTFINCGIFEERINYVFKVIQYTVILSINQYFKCFFDCAL